MTREELSEVEAKQAEERKTNRNALVWGMALAIVVLGGAALWFAI
ncbi:hypothetical protein [Afifella pfennigii]|nr:hypothetical protein [Afifella pfennigii]